MNDQNEILPEVEPVDMSELAQLMLEWERQKRTLGFTEDMIKDAVLNLGKTQNVGNVRATYTKGRVSYDYAEAAMRIDTETLRALELEYQEVTVNYKKICDAVKMDKKNIPASEQGAPSVSIKLV